MRRWQVTLGVALALGGCAFHTRSQHESGVPDPPAGPVGVQGTVAQHGPEGFGVSPRCEPWVPVRMAEIARVHAESRGFRPSSPLHCDDLGSDQERTFRARLGAGGCHMVIGVSREGTDLDLVVLDESGRPIDEDTLTDNFPIVQFCGSGTFTVRSRMYRSTSHYGIQAFSGGEPPTGQMRPGDSA